MILIVNKDLIDLYGMDVNLSHRNLKLFSKEMVDEFIHKLQQIENIMHKLNLNVRLSDSVKEIFQI